MEMTNGINIVKSKEKIQKESCVKKRSEDLISVLKGKKVTILGHDNIDVDATLSGILMSKLLDFLKIDNEFIIIEEVKRNETYEIIEETIGIDMRKWQVKGENPKRELFLVDHFETIHSGHVVGCIDHHPTKQEKGYEFKYTRKSCATAYLIYEIMKEVNFPITKEDVKMVIVAMMVDTVSFRSSKTIPKEAEEAKELARQYGIKYFQLERYCLCLTPIDKMSKAEIISNGQKWYNYNGHKVGSSYVQIYEMPNKELISEWLSSLKEKLRDNNSDMLVFIIANMKSNTTYEYQITKEEITRYVKNGILSRGQDIMPEIEAKYINR